MYISEEDLNLIKKLIFDTEMEVCGNFLTRDELKKYKIEVKEENDLNNYISHIGTVNTCQHKFYSRYIWHTHPSIEHAYPSPQDIMKVIKYDFISFVFTSWGVWEMYSNNPKNIDTITQEKLKTKYMKPIGDKIYTYTDRGRSINLTHRQSFIINDLTKQLIEKMNELGYELNIKFTEWKDISILEI